MAHVYANKEFVDILLKNTIIRMFINSGSTGSGTRIITIHLDVIFNNYCSEGHPQPKPKINSINNQVRKT
ncbi:hypothetical protein NQ317_018274 [Molorchus minor]|uniref:Uncharacterized protein n=1 Tax=Molorchus minor TaxID=1323400 RepID=A0ABQ9K519_9CUCU|nr:hypothetical protein NQ317_018274 [Molorchus minor]